jgi:hypothetical protein
MTSLIQLHPHLGATVRSLLQNTTSLIMHLENPIQSF